MTKIWTPEANFRGTGPLVDLICQILILDDRPGDQLGEERDKGAEVDDGPLGPGVSTVHVDGVPTTIIT